MEGVLLPHPLLQRELPRERAAAAAPRLLNLLQVGLRRVSRPVEFAYPPREGRGGQGLRVCGA